MEDWTFVYIKSKTERKIQWNEIKVAKETVLYISAVQEKKGFLEVISTMLFEAESLLSGQKKKRIWSSRVIIAECQGKKTPYNVSGEWEMIRHHLSTVCKESM